MNWIPACAGMTDFWSNGKSRFNGKWNHESIKSLFEAKSDNSGSKLALMLAATKGFF
jgi:hypothetical protein